MRVYQGTLDERAVVFLALLSSVVFLNTYAIEKLESVHFAAVVEAVWRLAKKGGKGRKRNCGLQGGVLSFLGGSNRVRWSSLLGWVEPCCWSAGLSFRFLATD